MVKLQQHAHWKTNPLYRKSCDCKNSFVVHVVQGFFLFKFSTKFLFLYLYLKSHDRNRIRDSLCQCGVTRASQCRGHLRFRLVLYAMSLNNVFAQSGNWKFVCLQFAMFFYCIGRFFGSQGRRHNTLYHSVLDVILVQLNEWIPVLLKYR